MILDANPKFKSDADKDCSARRNPIYVTRVLSAMVGLPVFWQELRMPFLTGWMTEWVSGQRLPRCSRKPSLCSFIFHCSADSPLILWRLFLFSQQLGSGPHLFFLFSCPVMFFVCVLFMLTVFNNQKVKSPCFGLFFLSIMNFFYCSQFCCYEGNKKNNKNIYFACFIKHLFVAVHVRFVSF